MRGLFITQGLGVGLYGAAKSIQELLQSFPFDEFDLIVPKGILVRNNKTFIKSLVGPKVRNIYELFTQGASDYCAFGTELHGSYSKIKNVIFRFLWLTTEKRRLRALIKQNDYDFIHINTILYHKIISQEFPMFIHVRELVNKNINEVATSLKKAEGVLFIDKGVYKPFEDFGLGDNIVLNNPFNMQPPDLSPKEYFGIDNAISKVALETTTIFAIIGMIVEEKGVHLIIEAFKRVKSDNLLLLIVGEGTNSETYYKFCKELAAEDHRIIWHGEEPKIEHIYAITDYVIRGEPQLLIGRTVYEGLYSGCGVILPVMEGDSIKDIFEYDTFRDRINTYKSRSADSLSSIISELKFEKIRNRTYKSNLQQFIFKFEQFINRKLQIIE